ERDRTNEGKRREVVLPYLGAVAEGNRVEKVIRSIDSHACNFRGLGTLVGRLRKGEVAGVENSQVERAHVHATVPVLGAHIQLPVVIVHVAKVIETGTG